MRGPAHYDVWLKACRAQQRVEMGESNQAPQGKQEDLNSSIITESQAAAMSPDCRVPAELCLSSSYSPFPFYLSLFGTGHRSRLRCCSRPLASMPRQGPNTCTNRTPTQACTRTNTQEYKRAAIQTQIDRGSNSLDSLLSTCRTCSPYV